MLFSNGPQQETSTWIRLMLSCQRSPVTWGCLTLPHCQTSYECVFRGRWEPMRLYHPFPFVYLPAGYHLHPQSHQGSWAVRSETQTTPAHPTSIWDATGCPSACSSPLSFSELPRPPLELFDLNKSFSSEKAQLAQIANKYTEEDLEFYVRKCGDILGITSKLPKDQQNAKQILEHISSKWWNSRNWTKNMMCIQVQWHSSTTSEDHLSKHFLHPESLCTLNCSLVPHQSVYTCFPLWVMLLNSWGTHFCYLKCNCLQKLDNVVLGQWETASAWVE